MLGELAVPGFFHPIQDLLEDPVPSVRAAALRAAQSVAAPELVPALLKALDDPSSGGAAVRALIASTAQDPSRLAGLARDPSLAAAARVALVRALGSSGASAPSLLPDWPPTRRERVRAAAYASMLDLRANGHSPLRSSRSAFVSSCARSPLGVRKAGGARGPREGLGASPPSRCSRRRSPAGPGPGPRARRSPLPAPRPRAPPPGDEPGGRAAPRERHRAHRERRPGGEGRSRAVRGRLGGRAAGSRAPPRRHEPGSGRARREAPREPGFVGPPLRPRLGGRLLPRGAQVPDRSRALVAGPSLPGNGTSRSRDAGCGGRPGKGRRKPDAAGAAREGPVPQAGFALPGDSRGGRGRPPADRR
ncbi:MAG: HEAT repeat domain-containing protein [Holophagales bacterium]|nr:HEAT repeat domain-containing protein [Holophagales bacterium]